MNLVRGAARQLFRLNDFTIQVCKRKRTTVSLCSNFGCSNVAGRTQTLSCTTCVNPRFFCTKNLENNQAEAEVAEPDIEALSNGDPEVAHRLKVIVLEASVLRQEGKCVPPISFLQETHWKELLKLQSRSARMKYLEFLFKIVKKKENRLRKKETKRLERESRLGEKPEVKTFEEFVTTYSLQHNNIFLRFHDTTINQFYNNRLIQAVQFGQKIVLDCGYESNMTDRENRLCAKQLMFLFSENRYHDDPYDLHLCNVVKEGTMMHALHRYIPTMYEPWFPLNVHESSYRDLFPAEKLVYLTPHCRQEMEEYDHEAVYIIGGIVDKVNNEPLSLANAKKEKIKMQKLPLDKYLQWGAGSGKSLTLNQMISILLDIKKTGDWKYALRHVPKRKLVDFSDTETDKTGAHKVRTDKSAKRSWSPDYNSNMNSLSYNIKKSPHEKNKMDFRKSREKRDRLIQVKNIIDD